MMGKQQGVLWVDSCVGRKEGSRFLVESNSSVLQQGKARHVRPQESSRGSREWRWQTRHLLCGCTKIARTSAFQDIYPSTNGTCYSPKEVTAGRNERDVSHGWNTMNRSLQSRVERKDPSPNVETFDLPACKVSHDASSSLDADVRTKFDGRLTICMDRRVHRSGGLIADTRIGTYATPCW